MEKIKYNIWIESQVFPELYENNDAIRVDWDNDWHHRTEIAGHSPSDLAKTFRQLADLIDEDVYKKNV